MLVSIGKLNIYNIYSTCSESSSVEMTVLVYHAVNLYYDFTFIFSENFRNPLEEIISLYPSIHTQAGSIPGPQGCDNETSYSSYLNNDLVLNFH